LPEITTDDAVTAEPVSGPTVVHVPVRLSSEMDNTVTVNKARGFKVKLLVGRR
jgi:hypothetical protein